jgi:hypothetical protein
MDYRLVKLLLATLVCALAAACGGGGGGSDDPDQGGGGPTTISGFVVKGPVRSATVTLLSVSSTGATAVLAQTSTAADGSFSFRAAPSNGSIVMVSATGGTYQDEATSVDRTLTTALRAVFVWQGVALTVSPTPYSEIGARILERSSPAVWSAESIRVANQRVADWAGITDILSFKPVPLMTTVDWSAFNERDAGMSLLSAVFSTLQRRLDQLSATTLEQAIEALYRLVVTDPYDDRLFPAFIGASADFVDLTVLGPDVKRALKSVILAGSEQPVSDGALLQAMPSGTASGGTTAPMPDGAFALVGFGSRLTQFNARGALVGFAAEPTSPNSWAYLYSASVGEVFGDGDVGIGRWHGGGSVATPRDGDRFEPVVDLVSLNPYHYAVGRPPLSVPTCGRHSMPLVAHTTPTLGRTAWGLASPVTGLTVDSRVSLQFLGETYLGADIGVTLADNSVVRYRTPGGAVAPWASYAAAGLATRPGDEIVLEPVAPAGILANRPLHLQFQSAGADAHKAALRLRWPGNESIEAAAAFASPTNVPDETACTVTGTVGAPIFPAPVDGEQFVFLTLGDTTTFLGAPRPATFSADGSLDSILGAQIAPPVYELAGSADASIGRLMVTDTSVATGATTTRSTPYAVVRPGAVVPSSGTVAYDLVTATGVIVQRGNNGAEIPPGTVTAASLQIVHGEYPLGTPSLFYGTVLLRIEGNVAGVPFLVADVVDRSQPNQGRSYEAAFFTDVASGAVSAPDGQFAAVQFDATAGGAQVRGTLLFRRRGG